MSVQQVSSCYHLHHGSYKQATACLSFTLLLSQHDVTKNPEIAKYHGGNIKEHLYLWLLQSTETEGSFKKMLNK